MATAPIDWKSEEWTYPTSDGRPMAETDWHRDLMFALVKMLETYYSDQPMVYVSGNLLVFYEEGDRHKHLSPDVFVVRGVPKRQRPNYLIWREAKAPEMVIELTSKSTRKEDLEEKYQLYRDRLRVKEYFLFDPRAEYLDPPLQGFRLRKGDYEPIEPVSGRLPSKITGLHLERHGRQLRLYDPETAAWLPTPEEARKQAEEAQRREAEARQKAEAEVERLRRQLKKLKRRSR